MEKVQCNYNEGILHMFAFVFIFLALGLSTTGDWAEQVREAVKKVKTFCSHFIVFYITVCLYSIIVWRFKLVSPKLTGILNKRVNTTVNFTYSEKIHYADLSALHVCHGGHGGGQQKFCG